MRRHGIGRWNYSQKADKWVYVELDEEGNRVYKYQTEPPPQFVDLSKKIAMINKKLMTTTDEKENKRLFVELMEISKKMQKMRNNYSPRI